MTPLNAPIIIRPAVTSLGFKVLEVTDYPSARTVKAQVCLCDDPMVIKWFTVWKDEAYDQIGQWTDSDLQDAIKALIQSPLFSL